VEFVCGLCESPNNNERLTLIGPSGSGRTSILNLVREKLTKNKNGVHVVSLNCVTLVLRGSLPNMLVKVGQSVNFFYRPDSPDTNRYDNFIERKFYSSVRNRRHKKYTQAFLENADQYTANEYMNSLAGSLVDLNVVLLVDNFDSLTSVQRSEIVKNLETLHKKIPNIVTILVAEPRSCVIPDLENLELSIDISKKEFLPIPFITGLNKEKTRKLIRDIISKSGISLSSDWNRLIEREYNNNIGEIKRFINCILVYPKLEGSEGQVHRISDFRENGRRPETAVRFIDHYCRVASVLMLREKHPEYYVDLLEKSDYGIKFLDAIHGANSADTAKDEISRFLWEHFRYDGNGYSFPFFREEDAEEYLTFTFRAKPLTPMEEYLNEWFRSNDGLFSEKIKKDNLYSADKLIDRLVRDNKNRKKGRRLHDLEIFHMLYWIAKALHDQFEKRMDKMSSMVPKIKRDDLLLRRLNDGLDIAKDIVVTFLFRVEIYEYNGDSSRISLLGENGHPVPNNYRTMSQLLFLKNLFKFLDIELKICRNHFTQAEIEIKKYDESLIKSNYAAESRDWLRGRLELTRERMNKKVSGVESRERNIEFELFISHRVGSIGSRVADSVYHSMTALFDLPHSKSIYYHPRVVDSGDHWEDDLNNSIFFQSRAFFLVLDDEYMSYRADRENWTHAEAVAARAMQYKYNCPIFWCYFSEDPHSSVLESKDFARDFSWLMEYQSLHESGKSSFNPKIHINRSQRREYNPQYVYEDAIDYITQKIGEKLSLREIASYSATSMD
jgi:hypothetical protein